MNKAKGCDAGKGLLGRQGVFGEGRSGSGREGVVEMECAPVGPQSRPTADQARTGIEAMLICSCVAAKAMRASLFLLLWTERHDTLGRQHTQKRLKTYRMVSCASKLLMLWVRCPTKTGFPDRRMEDSRKGKRPTEREKGRLEA